MIDLVSHPSQSCQYHLILKSRRLQINRSSRFCNERLPANIWLDLVSYVHPFSPGLNSCHALTHPSGKGNRPSNLSSQFCSSCYHQKPRLDSCWEGWLPPLPALHVLCYTSDPILEGLGRGFPIHCIIQDNLQKQLYIFAEMIPCTYTRTTNCWLPGVTQNWRGKSNSIFTREDNATMSN
jgi:hypothetical protein